VTSDDEFPRALLVEPYTPPVYRVALGKDVDPAQRNSRAYQIAHELTHFWLRVDAPEHFFTEVCCVAVSLCALSELATGRDPYLFAAYRRRVERDAFESLGLGSFSPLDFSRIPVRTSNTDITPEVVCCACVLAEYLCARERWCALQGVWPYLASNGQVDFASWVGDVRTNMSEEDAQFARRIEQMFALIASTKQTIPPTLKQLLCTIV